MAKKNSTNWPVRSKHKVVEFENFDLPESKLERLEVKSLKPRQLAFCYYYAKVGFCTYGNGTQSAIAAGYSPTSGHVTASILLTRADIKRQISLYLSNRIEAEPPPKKVVMQKLLG